MGKESEDGSPDEACAAPHLKDLGQALPLRSPTSCVLGLPWLCTRGLLPLPEPDLLWAAASPLAPSNPPRDGALGPRHQPGEHRARRSGHRGVLPFPRHLCHLVELLCCCWKPCS